MGQRGLWVGMKVGAGGRGGREGRQGGESRGSGGRESRGRHYGQRASHSIALSSSVRQGHLPADHVSHLPGTDLYNMAWLCTEVAGDGSPSSRHRDQPTPTRTSEQPQGQHAQRAFLGLGGATSLRHHLATTWLPPWLPPRCHLAARGARLRGRGCSSRQRGASAAQGAIVRRASGAAVRQGPGRT